MSQHWRNIQVEDIFPIGPSHVGPIALYNMRLGSQDPIRFYKFKMLRAVGDILLPRGVCRSVA